MTPRAVGSCGFEVFGARPWGEGHKLVRTFFGLADACQESALLKGSDNRTQPRAESPGCMWVPHLCFNMDSLCDFAQVPPCLCSCQWQDMLTEVPLMGHSSGEELQLAVLLPPGYGAGRELNNRVE